MDNRSYSYIHLFFPDLLVLIAADVHWPESNAIDSVKKISTYCLSVCRPLPTAVQSYGDHSPGGEHRIACWIWHWFSSVRGHVSQFVHFLG